MPRFFFGSHLAEQLELKEPDAKSRKTPWIFECDLVFLKSLLI
jgi:hypothetical protein